MKDLDSREVLVGACRFVLVSAAIVTFETAYAVSATCTGNCLLLPTWRFAVPMVILATFLQLPLLALGKWLYGMLFHKRRFADVLIWGLIYAESSLAVVMNGIVLTDDICCYRYDLSEFPLEVVAATHTFSLSAKIIFFCGMIGIAWAERAARSQWSHAT